MSRTAVPVILFGGESSERKVSVATSQHLAEILPQARCWFWAPDGKVHEIRRDALLKHERPFEREFQPGTAPTWPNVEAALDLLDKNAVVVLGLHGKGGEDGQVQAWLEARRLFFTGSSAEASCRAFDKAASKRAVSKAGVRTPQSRLVTGKALARAEATIRDMWQQHGRTIIKPVADGSSHGVIVVEDESSFRAAINELQSAPQSQYLAEEFINGREITVGVYDSPAGPVALPASEVVLDRGRRFDYEGKYLGHGTKEITPADLKDETYGACARLALAAHESVGCLGYSRTDMIVDERGPVFLEINNLPGLTRASFVPQQLKVARISVTDFITRQLALARTRYGQKTKTKKGKPRKKPSRTRSAHA